MPRRTLILTCLVAVGSQVSVGCCCWRPFARFWPAGGCCAPACGGGPAVGGPMYGAGFGGPVGGPPGCSSCGSSPLAAGAAPVPAFAGATFSAPPPVIASQGLPAPGGVVDGYPVIGQSVTPTGSVFTSPPVQFPSPSITRDPVPAQLR